MHVGDVCAEVQRRFLTIRLDRNIFSLEQRLRILEHNLIPIEKILELHYRLELVERQSKQRIAMLEQRQELLAQVLVKLTKRKQ